MFFVNELPLIIDYKALGKTFALAVYVFRNGFNTQRS